MKKFVKSIVKPKEGKHARPTPEVPKECNHDYNDTRLPNGKTQHKCWKCQHSYTTGEGIIS